MPRKSSIKDDTDALNELLLPAEPALSTMDLVAVREAVNLPPEQFEKAVAPVFQRLLVTGLANMPEPSNYKELATVAKLHRSYSGLDKKDATAMPQGLVSFLRPVGRRTLSQDAEIVEDPFAV